MKNAHMVQRQWNYPFNMSPPALPTITAVNQRFNKKGSVEDLSRTGRPATILTEERIYDMVNTNPQLPIRQGSFQAQVQIMLLYTNCN